MKKILIILLMILLILPLTYSLSLSTPTWICGDKILDEHFDYDDFIENHGWEWDEAQSDKNNRTLVSPFFTPFSYGFNQTSTSAAAHIKFDLGTNISNKKIIFSMNYSATTGDFTRATSIFMRTDHLAGAGYNYASNSFNFIFDQAGNFTTKFFTFSGDTCDLKSVNTYDNPFVGVVTAEIDLVQGTFSAYVNNTPLDFNSVDEDCINRAFGVPHISSILINFDSPNPGDFERYIDDLVICEGIPTATISTCTIPSLFCDDFNYDTPMADRDWFVRFGAGQINDSFTPKNEKLTLDSDKNILPYHLTGAFETSYRPDSGTRFTQHVQSPVFSSQFDLNIINQSGSGFKYGAFQLRNILGYIVKAEIDDVGNSSGNVNWFYVNETQPSVIWKQLCGNCTSTGQDTAIKMNSFFQQRDEFPFNSSVADDEIQIYADNILLGVIEDFLDERITHLALYEIIKESEYNYTVDNYFVMTGLDKDTPTFREYYSDFFIDEINETADIGTGTSGDMAEAIGTIWDDMGLISNTSRIMSGLFLMFLLAMLMFGLSLQTNHPLSARVLIVAEFFLMLILVYIKLLPIWLPFVIILVAAGIGAAAFKMGTQT